MNFIFGVIAVLVLDVESGDVIWFFFKDVADGSVLELISLLLLFLFLCMAGCMRIEDAVSGRLSIGWVGIRSWRMWRCGWIWGLES